MSTAQQADSGAGPDAQRAALTAAATAPAGDSLTPARPGLATALAMLAAGEAKVLMVSKLDWPSRSVAHGAGLLELAAKQRWALVALDLAVHTSSPRRKCRPVEPGPALHGLPSPAHPAEQRHRLNR